MILDIALGAVCLGLLLASAFFSGSETALFALRPHERHLLSKRSDARARRVTALLRDMSGVLNTVLVSNTFVNIFLAVLATRIFIRQLGPQTGPLVSGLVTTLTLLLLGEILPKSLAVNRPLEGSLRIGPALFKVKGILSPLTRFLRRLNHSVIHILDRVLPGDPLDMQLEDVDALLSLAGEEGSIGSKERELVRGALELGSTAVGEAMTPRVDLFLLEASLPAAEAAQRLKGSGYSRALVFEGSPDQLLGLLHAVDLLGQEKSGRRAGELARPARFCPESQRAGALLRELLDEGLGEAVVLDEYGSLAGLATLEDLYELLVGDILSTGDLESRRYYLPDEKTLIASSRMEISRLKEIFDVQLEEAEADTLGGYLMETLGEVPVVGERYELGDLTWTVLGARGPALRTLRLEKRS